MRFVGGILDGEELEVDERYTMLNVPVKDGEWYDPGEMVPEVWEVYERRGGVMIWIKSIGG